MALIGSVSGVYGSANALSQLGGATEALKTARPAALTGGVEKTKDAGFGNLFEDMIMAVNSQQQQAQGLARDVWLGKSDNLHGSMIAMQEAGVAFQMMVEVRNKVVESYQELMRMPV